MVDRRFEEYGDAELGIRFAVGILKSEWSCVIQTNAARRRGETETHVR